MSADKITSVADAGVPDLTPKGINAAVASLKKQPPFLVCPGCKGKTRISKKTMQEGAEISYCGWCGWLKEPSKYARVKHLNQRKGKGGFIVRKENLKKKPLPAQEEDSDD